MKKFLLFLFFVAATFIFGISKAQETTPLFKDVPEKHKFFIPIQFLSQQKIIRGFSSGNYKPFVNIKKKEAIAMIFKSAGITYNVDPLPKALEMGLIINDELSEGNKPISKIRFMKMLFKVYEIDLDEKNFFVIPENPILEYAKLFSLLIDRDDEKTLDKNLTRGKAAAILYQFLEKKDLAYLDGMYGKIFAHEHYAKGTDMKQLFEAMNLNGIEKVLLLPTGGKPDNRGYKKHQDSLLKIKQQYPDRVIAFCTIDEQDKEAAQVLEDCVKRGGEGLKILGGHPNFYDEPLNSENMYGVYKVAQKYKLPVIIHASIINIPELKPQLEQIYKDFPDTKFIHSHYCSTIMEGVNLEMCAEMLDKYPNLYIDLTMGGGIARYHKYLQSDYEEIYNFVVKYQDRILISSDMLLRPGLTLDFLASRIKCDLDLHQKETYTCAFGESEWEHHGFNLGKAILKKWYFDNPRKVLGLDN